MNGKPSSELENAPDELKNLVKKKTSIMSAINQIKSRFQQSQIDQNQVERNMPQSQTSELFQFLENFESLIDNGTKAENANENDADKNDNDDDEDDDEKDDESVVKSEEDNSDEELGLTKKRPRSQRSRKKVYENFESIMDDNDVDGDYDDTDDDVDYDNNDDTAARSEEEDSD